MRGAQQTVRGEPLVPTFPISVNPKHNGAIDASGKQVSAARMVDLLNQQHRYVDLLHESGQELRANLITLEEKACESGQSDGEHRNRLSAECERLYKTIDNQRLLILALSIISGLLVLALALVAHGG